jgi:serine/threonine protein phosphatase 1
MERLAIIGDVHGSASCLATAVDWLSENWTGRIVFVGDYINRGPESKSVMDMLCRCRNAWGTRLNLLLGNHDASLLNFLKTGHRTAFVRHGGLQTMQSYLGAYPAVDPFDQFRRTFPGEHRSLLNAMELFYEDEDVLVSHAGYNPASPGSRSIADIVFGPHAELFASPGHTPPPLVVCGHYVQRSKSAFVSTNFICIDTGCGSIAGAPLTLIELPARRLHTFRGMNDRD